MIPVFLSFQNDKRPRANTWRVEETKILQGYFPRHSFAFLCSISILLSCISVFLYLGNPYSCVSQSVNTLNSCFVAWIRRHLNAFSSEPYLPSPAQKFNFSAIFALSSAPVSPGVLIQNFRIISKSGLENCFQKVKSRPKMAKPLYFVPLWSPTYTKSHIWSPRAGLK